MPRSHAPAGAAPRPAIATPRENALKRTRRPKSNGGGPSGDIFRWGTLRQAFAAYRAIKITPTTASASPAILLHDIGSPKNRTASSGPPMMNMP
jgi:hypothetical protein